MTQGEDASRREKGGRLRGQSERWPWTPATRPELPDRVLRLETDVETLQSHADRLRRAAWAVAAAGWIVAAELAYLLARGLL